MKQTNRQLLICDQLQEQACCTAQAPRRWSAYAQAQAPAGAAGGHWGPVSLMSLSLLFTPEADVLWVTREQCPFLSECLPAPWGFSGRSGEWMDCPWAPRSGMLQQPEHITLVIRPRGGENGRDASLKTYFVDKTFLHLWWNALSILPRPLALLCKNEQLVDQI